MGSATQPSQKPDVMARGEQPYLIDLNNVIVQNNGTSFSGPIMAGGIACLMQALPNKTNIEIMNLVRESGSQYNSPDYQLGYGVPNLFHALEQGLSTNTYSGNKFKIYPNPVVSNLFVEIPGSLKEVSFQLYNVLGELIIDSFKRDDFSINIEHLHSGIYIAKVSGDGFVESYKLIKK
jgi:hypothetical protein